MTLLPLQEKYLNAFSKNANWFLAWGTILVILGIAAISATTLTTLVSVVFLGFLLLIGGIITAFDSFTFWQRSWSGFFLHIALAILYVIAGIGLIKNPILGSISITLFLGVFYVIVGIFRIIYPIVIRMPHWGWNLFNGIVSLLLGILILDSWPQSSAFIIGLFIGIDLLLSGWTYIMASLAARAVKKDVVTTTPATPS